MYYKDSGKECLKSELVQEIWAVFQQYAFTFNNQNNQNFW